MIESTFRLLRRVAVLVLLALPCCIACSGHHAANGSVSAGPSGSGGAQALDGSANEQSDASAGDSNPEAGTAFEGVLPTVYVAKVKNLLLGLPATDAEVSQVLADPTQFKSLVLTWMQQPEYQKKMLRFFELAFQQTQLSAADFSDQAYPQQIGINSSTTPQLLENTEESFARTMLALIANGQPLSAGITTQDFMMTTALKELYAFLDVWEVDDNGKVTDRFKQGNPKLTITVGSAAGPVAISDTLDPNSPNYMHWYDADVATAGTGVSGCNVDPIVYPAKAITLHYLLYGSLDNWKNSAGVNCPPTAGTAAAPQLTASDFSDWTMVHVRQPSPGEPTTAFYDLPSLRSSTELVLSIPRVGFFSTPAFFANWPTNISNQMRVTMNQTLIVALGSQVDGSDPTITPGKPPPGLDTIHAALPECAGCHQTLDPLRSVFSANYSWNYHNQLDAAWTAQTGMFAFQGVIQPVASMFDLASILAEHPLFAAAWAQKLCYYANSVPCSPTDPEFQRVVAAFQGSGLSWNTLVSEMLSSPLVTHAAETQTSDTNGEVVSVLRRDHFCAALENRLGLADPCALAATTKKQGTIPQIASGLPSDGYGRGSTIPVLPNQPTLFYRAAMENICIAVASLVIDVTSSKRVAGVKYWSSTEPQTAISDFVATLMGLPTSDPKSSSVVTLLQNHFNAAVQQGASASSALKSAFVTACLAPSAVAMGM